MVKQTSLFSCGPDNPHLECWDSSQLLDRSQSAHQGIATSEGPRSFTLSLVHIVARQHCRSSHCRSSTLSPFAPQKCVSGAHFCGAKADINHKRPKSIVVVAHFDHARYEIVIGVTFFEILNLVIGSVLGRMYFLNGAFKLWLVLGDKDPIERSTRIA